MNDFVHCESIGDIYLEIPTRTFLYYELLNLKVTTKAIFSYIKRQNSDLDVLVVAIKNNNYELAKSIIENPEAKAQLINTGTFDNFIDLIIYYDRLELLKLLDISAIRVGYANLAAYHNKFEILKYIYSLTQDLYCTYHDWDLYRDVTNLPLKYAMLNDNREMIAFIMSQVNVSPQTLLLFSVISGNIDLLKSSLRNGAKLKVLKNSSFRYHYKSSSYFISIGRIRKKPDETNFHISYLGKNNIIIANIIEHMHKNELTN